MKMYKGNIFKYRKYNSEKLLKYGFDFIDGIYVYNTKFFNGEFNLKIVITQDSQIETLVVENSSSEEFNLIYLENAKGKFIGDVKEEFNKILTNISEKCFFYSVFKSKYAEMIINYVKDKYDSEAEYLWEKFPNNAVFRNKNNQKWYGAILTADRKTLKLKGDGEIEIIDLKNSPNVIESIVDGKKILPAYHMNKKHWFTICLDGSVDISEIYKYIDESYRLVKT